ncbi:MAG: hypothetical protein WC661_16925 [Opitutaceae bacterium]|jgi:hypothetical protein
MNPRLERKLAGRSRRIAFIPPTVKQVKVLIWIYFWLIIFEGSLRKWGLPALSDPLLIIRDPVVLLIYLQAVRGGFFPQHWLVKITIWLGVITFFWGCVHIFEGGSYLTAVVTLYGVRTYFLHLPLIFIMGHVFKREDVLKVGKWCLILAVPMAFLMVAQYKVDPGHWLNKGTLGDESGQLRAAMGKIRPPGTFSFITGPATFYPLVTAFLIYGVMQARTYAHVLLAAAAGATFLVLPVSGSRTLVLASAIVVVMAAVVLVKRPSLIPRFAIWTAVVMLGGLALLTLPVGQQAVESFTARWDSASEFEGEGSGATAISKRLGGGFAEVFYLLDQIPIAGYGIGAGTNVGVKLMTGGVGFMYGENEWTRNVMEAGPILGFTYIGFRIVFAVFLLNLAWKRLGKGDPLPWLLMGCCVVNLIMGQTTQPTTLGFMVFIAGLSLSSVGVMQKKEPISENRRRWLAQKERVRRQGIPG